MLKENEKRMLNALHSIANNNTIHTSAKKIQIRYQRKKRIFEKVDFEPSKEAKLNTLKALAKKGYIELDYSKQTEPKIIIKKYNVENN